MSLKGHQIFNGIWHHRHQSLSMMLFVIVIVIVVIVIIIAIFHHFVHHFNCQIKCLGEVVWIMICPGKFPAELWGYSQTQTVAGVGTQTIIFRTPPPQFSRALSWADSPRLQTMLHKENSFLRIC